MFNNIGNKIKTLAKIITIFGFIAFSIFATILCFVASIIDGLLVLVSGCLSSWIGSFLLYGFGELIDNTTEIANNTRNTNISSELTSSKVTKLLTILKKQNLDLTKDIFLTKFKIGKQVLHKYFGIGKIVSALEDKMIIDFTESGKGLSKMELDIDFCLENNLIEILD